MAEFLYDVGEVAPDQGGGALPPGTHELQAVEETLKASSTGKGMVLALTYEVASGQYQGRKLWVTINMTHDNPVAQKIGQGQISALCHAIGGPDFKPRDTEELLWKPFWADTDVEPNTYKGKTTERGIVKKYLFGDDLQPPEEKAPAQQQRPVQRSAPPSRPKPAAAAPGGAAGGRSLPWKRPGAGAQAGNGIPPESDDVPF